MLENTWETFWTGVQAVHMFKHVSLSSMSREFNQLVCVDHMFLDEFKVFHIMDSVTRYSSGVVVPDTTMRMHINLCL